MARTLRIPSRVAVLLASALVAVACGGGATVKQTSFPGPTGGDDLPTPVNASAATLKLSDFPAGWAIDDSEDDATDEDTKCAPAIETSTVDSQTFTKDTARVNNSIDKYDTVGEATTDFALFRDPKFLECFRQELAVELAQQDPADPVKISDLVLAPVATPKWGQDTTALRFTATASANGVTVPMIFDLVVVRVGRLIDGYFFFDVQPFDEALRNSLIGASSARISA